jgi:putative DNA primase/helicase
MTAEAIQPDAEDTPGIPLIPRHRELLNARGIVDEFLDAEHIAPVIRSVETWEQLPEEFRWSVERETPSGILYGDGNGGWQFRPDSPRANPDDPNDKPAKYVTPAGCPPLTPVRSAPMAGDTPQVGQVLVIVEGTNQALATACALRNDPGYIVVGISGCQNWRHGSGGLHPTIRALAKGASRIFTIPDADAGTNKQVYTAFTGLKSALINHLNGRRNVVSFVQLPADHGATTGIDDLLAGVAEDERAGYLSELFEGATPKPADVAPTARDSAVFGDDHGPRFFKDDDPGPIDPLAIAQELTQRYHFGLDLLTGELAMYNNHEGVYEIDPPGQKSGRLRDAMLDLLRSDYHSKHVSSVEDAVRKLLREQARFLDHRVTVDEEVHVDNGHLCMESWVLFPHDPDRMSTRKFAVAYNPSAIGTNLDELLSHALVLFKGEEDEFDQRPILYDGLSTLLDEGYPERLVFLLGPPRCGKGTTSSLLEQLVGRYLSGVSLKDLAESRFSAARLYGSLLNTVGETERNHIDDITTLLKATGGDVIEGEKKGQDSFTFRNRALFLFLGNNLPTITDPDGAFESRTTAVQYVKAEVEVDPELKQRILRDPVEAEALLLQLLRARHARKKRGWKYLPSHPTVHTDLQNKLNPTAEFVATRLEKTPTEQITGVKTAPEEWVTRKMAVFGAYRTWCLATGARPMKSPNFFKAIRQSPASVREGHTSTGSVKGFLCRIKEDPDGDYADPRARSGLAATPIPGSRIGEQEAGVPTEQPEADTQTRPLPEDGPESDAEARPAPEPETPTKGNRSMNVAPALDSAGEPSSVPEHREAVISAAREAATADPALARLTPGFWQLLADRGMWLPKPAAGTGQAMQSRYLTQSSTAAAHVVLNEVAATVGLPPLHARGYLRAIAERLDGLGIELRDRRTAATGTPGAIAPLTGWVSKEDRAAAKANAQKAKAALSAATRAVKQAEKRRATRPADLATLQKAEAAAAAIAEEAAVQARNLSSLPVERHGYAVLISPAT